MASSNPTLSPTPDDLSATLSRVLDDIQSLQASLASTPTAPGQDKSLTQDPEFWQNPQNVTSTTLQTSRFSLLDSIDHLNRVLLGPRYYLRSLVGQHWELAAWQTIQKFQVLEKIPNGEIEIMELAAKCGIDEDVLLRLLRLVSCRDLVKEARTGVFERTVVGRALVEDRGLNAAMERVLDFTAKELVELGDSLKKNPFPTKTEETAFHYKWGTSVYGYQTKHPELAEAFAAAMEGWNRMDNSMFALEKYFATTTDPRSKRTVVCDVGGGSGHASVSLAKQFPTLEFVVLDIQPEMYAKTVATLPASLSNRIKFAKHDFFTPFPDPPPSTISFGSSKFKCYLLRWVLHNWRDPESIEIIKHFVPLLKADPETSLLINDLVVPEPGSVPRCIERFTRQKDIATLANFNTKERSEADWKRLLEMVDEGLQLVRVISDVTVGLLGVLEVRYVKPL